MTCTEMMDKVYEYSYGEESAMPLLTRLQLGLHLLFCPDCTRKMERFEAARDVLHGDFLPRSPDFVTSTDRSRAEGGSPLEYSVMNMIAREEGETLAALEAEADSPGGLSTRGWVITGLIILVSLSTAFFGLEFNRMALDAGMSFLLPMGIVIGLVLTSYGALFIGSHLKELSERFGL